MTQSASNLRVRRTQKLLREAFIELIEERGFDALTISELTERAMVSRAAFYRTYQDKYDLVEQIFEEALSALLNAIGEMCPEQHPPEIWVTFFEHIAKYERLYRALLGSKGSSWFVRKMRASLADLVKAHGHGHRLATADRPVLTFSDELVPDLVSTMLVEAITWWLEQGRPSTPREIATRCTLLISALFKEVSTWH
jgi:AcrR family transcriptional regulator